MQHGLGSISFGRRLLCSALVPLLVVVVADTAWAASTSSSAAANLDWREMFRAGGTIGIIIASLSVAMVALIFEHLISIRRSALMPRGLAEDIHQLLAQGQVSEAQQRCRARPSFLSNVLSAGLTEIGLGYSAIEKAMEDASVEQSARLFRKIDYLSVIGTLAPMLGLLGTVWGMILAFLEFESKANPQVAELAPGIYKALVTTLLGLSVAVPALASYAFFRNRIDELVADASLTAEHVFADFRRAQIARKRDAKRKKRGDPGKAPTARPEPRVPSVAIERDKNG